MAISSLSIFFLKEEMERFQLWKEKSSQKNIVIIIQIWFVFLFYVIRVNLIHIYLLWRDNMYLLINIK